MSRAEIVIRQRLEHARTQIVEFERMADSIRDGYCSIAFEEDLDESRAALRVRIKPHPPAKLAVLAGEIVSGLRSVLDRMVFGMVEANPPFTLGIANQFPIHETVEGYEGDVRRKRLVGVPDEAIAIIESLQPYHAGNRALLTLDKLYDVKKHRSLHVSTAISSYSELFLGRRTRFVGDEYFRDGSVYGWSVTKDLEQRFFEDCARLRKEQFEGKCAVAVVLEDPTTPDISNEDEFKLAGSLLWGLQLFVEQKIWMPLFDFIADAHEATSEESE